MLGTCCLKVERTASAIRYFENALALDPRHVGARRALLGLGRRPTFERPSAKPISRKHLRKNPKRSRNRSDRATLRLAQLLDLLARIAEELLQHRIGIDAA